MSKSPTTAASLSCAACLTGSTTPASKVRSCRSTPPTSTTCSSPSPATPPQRPPPRNECPELHRHRFGNDAASQPATSAALPLDDLALGWHADRVPAAVRLRLRRPTKRRAQCRRCPLYGLARVLQHLSHFPDLLLRQLPILLLDALPHRRQRLHAISRVKSRRVNLVLEPRPVGQSLVQRHRARQRY